MSQNDPTPVKTETPVLTATPVITATPLAIEKIKDLLAEKNLPEHGLRIFVAGASCSGLQYGMALEGEPRDSDSIVEADGIRLIVDPVSLPYIRGSKIDFIDNPMGGGFSIDNPNVQSTCSSTGCSGCG